MTDTSKRPRRVSVPRVLLFLALAPAVLFVVAVTAAIQMQDAVVARLLTELNGTMDGSIAIQRSRITPFADFPRVSVDVQGIEVREDPAHGAATILRVDDLYLGLDLLRLLTGVAEMRSVRLVGASLDLVEHLDGSLNLANALARRAPPGDAPRYADPLASALPGLNLKGVAFRDLRLRKVSEIGAYAFEARVAEGSLALVGSERPLRLALDADLELTILKDGAPTFFHDHAVALHTALTFDPASHLLTVTPSEVRLEDARFRIEGTADLVDDLALDLTLEGDKPNFDLFLAFAPPELAPLLEAYENRGRVYFKATAKGPSINGHVPALEIDFGCEDGILLHRDIDDGIRNLAFRAHFSNGSERSAASSEFALTGLNADPAAGYFRGDLVVRNFAAPEIDLRVDAELDLAFLARFVGVENAFDLAGEVRLQTRFRDVIDLEQPARTLDQLRQSYETRLRVNGVRFQSPHFPHAFEDIEVVADLENDDMAIERLRLRYGATRLSVTGEVRNLPALLHQRDLPVEGNLRLEAENIALGLPGKTGGAVPTLSRVVLPMALRASGASLWQLPATRQGDLEVRLENARVEAGSALGALEIPALDARLAGATLTLDLPALHSAAGDLRLELRIDDLGILLDGRDRNIEISTAFALDGFSPAPWLSALAPGTLVPAAIDRVFRSAGGRFTLGSTGAALRQAGVPALRLEGEDVHAEVEGGPAPLREFAFVLEHSARESTRLSASGHIGESPVSLVATAQGLASLADAAPDGAVRGTLEIETPRLVFGDLQPGNGAFPLPEDWAGETLEDLTLTLSGGIMLAAGNVSAIDVELESLRGRLSAHALPVSDARGRLRLDDEGGIQLRDTLLRVGESELRLELDHHPRDDAGNNRLLLHAPSLDFDTLTLWTPPTANAAPVDHDAGFSVFDLPFPAMRHELRIDQLTYHRMRIDDFQAVIHTRPDHGGRIDDLGMRIAGGRMALRGAFEGEDRTRIRFLPELELEAVDLDQLLFKFENFGQDHLVSENLHGHLTGRVQGAVLLHADLTPLLNESRLEVDVLVRDGMLERFGPLEALGDYFRDHNLARVRFGDLGNRLRMQEGVLEIPTMTVNTSLGFLEVSGRQTLEGAAEYLVRVPWRMVTGAGFSRLFGRRRGDVDPDQLDEIEYRDPERRVRFVTLRVASEADGWRVGLARGAR
jgi:hypothetical protein